MTNTNELDIRLRAFINAPDNFLDSVALVNALHNNSVLASDQPYTLEIDGQKVTPVFSDKDDLETFKTEQASALQQNWVERSTLDVLREVVEKGLTGLVFNLKKTGDFGNSTIFKSSELIQFLNVYTSILNKLMGEENLAADVLDKYYLVPAFVHPRDDKSFNRMFPTMSTPEGKSYVPAFSNLQSFAKWYNHNDFGLPFRKAQGSVLTWRLADIYQPGHGENDIDETVGVAINPFDDQQILVDWSEIDEDE
ncbi:SseB family protein [Streptococcus pasteurianus]|uniref:SseB family protein n=1 Tax=Streptococcus pasteurianus TaxID=197614 RepID=UPI0018ABAE4C|nr:SseB family protein [Streptococcus pasteurianus]